MNDQPDTLTPQSSTPNWIMIIVVFVVVILVIGGIGYYMVAQRQPTPLPPAVKSPELREPTGPIRVEFSYQVLAVTPQMITLLGDNGEMDVANNATKVMLYSSEGPAGNLLPLDTLEVGDQVVVEFVPGVKTNLFLVSE